MTKSIDPSSLYLRVAVLRRIIIYIFMTSFIIGGVASNPTYKELEIVDDLPVKSNLGKYLASLEKAIYFVKSHKDYVDVTLYFGVFLVKVNLKTALPLRGRLPAQKRIRLERMMKTNDEIIKYFDKMAHIYYAKKEQDGGITEPVVNLLKNDMLWPSQLRTFNIELLNRTKFYSRKQLETVYFKWPLYKKALNSSNMRSLGDLNICLELLAQNPVNYKDKLVHCQVPYTCAQAVVNGTHFGPGMMSRISFLILARHTRGCALLKPEEDRNLLDQLCARVYNECEFIAHHDFDPPDLFMKQISMCSLEGHAQFLRRSWIDEALDYQTRLGCFNNSRPEDEDKEVPLNENFMSWELKTEQMIFGNFCSVHTTAVGIAMLGSAIRYILENYY